MDIFTAREQYCASKPLRPGTIHSYTTIVSTFVTNTGVRKLEQITPDLLNDWKDTVAKRSSPSTFNTYHRHLHALFNYCVKKNYMNRNPLVDVWRFNRIPSRGKTADLRDLKKLCRYLNDRAGTLPSAWIFLLMIQVLYYTGMRRAQICGLCWNDIDFEQEKILLRREYSKNAREWSVPLDSRLKSALMALKLQTMDRLKNEYSDDRQVFCIQLFDRRYAGERLTPEQFTAALRRIAKRTGVKLSPHMIRHLVATSLANLDHVEGLPPMSLVAVKDLLGHMSINTTTLYIETDLKSQKRLLKRLDDLL